MKTTDERKPKMRTSEFHDMMQEDTTYDQLVTQLKAKLPHEEVIVQIVGVGSVRIIIDDVVFPLFPKNCPFSDIWETMKDYCFSQSDYLYYQVVNDKGETHRDDSPQAEAQIEKVMDLLLLD